MSLTEKPVTDVSVPQQLVLCRSIKPNVCTKSRLEIVLPVTFVSFFAGEPVHASIAVSFIVFPCSFIVVSTGISHLSLSPLHASLPVSLVNGAVVVGEHTFSVSHAILPLAVILNAFLFVYVFSSSVSEAIHDLAFIDAAVWPLVLARASDLVGGEFTTVDRTVSPLECTFAVKKTMLKLSLVGVSVSKLASSLPMVNFANLYKNIKFG